MAKKTSRKKVGGTSRKRKPTKKKTVKKSVKKTSRKTYKPLIPREPGEPLHCVVKHRTGKCEKYDERKVYGSVYAACYVCHMKHASCAKIANEVSKHVTKFIRKHKKVHTKHITKHAIKHLKKHSKKAAFMYKTHMDIS